MKSLRPISSQPNSLVRWTVGIRNVSPAARHAKGNGGANRHARSHLQRQTNSDQTMRRWHSLEWIRRRRAPVASAVPRAVELDRPALSEQQVPHRELDGVLVARGLLQQRWNGPQRVQASPSVPTYATPTRLHTQLGRLIHPMQRNGGRSLHCSHPRSSEARCGRRRYPLSEHRFEAGGTA